MLGSSRLRATTAASGWSSLSLPCMQLRICPIADRAHCRHLQKNVPALLKSTARELCIRRHSRQLTVVSPCINPTSTDAAEVQQEQSTTAMPATGELVADAAAQLEAEEQQASAAAAEHVEGNGLAVDDTAGGASTGTTGSRAAELGPTGGTVGRNGLSTPNKAQLPQMTAAQKVKEQLGDLSAKYQALDSRLDDLENTLIALLKDAKAKAKRPATAAAVGPAGEAVAADGGAVIGDGVSAEDLPAYTFLEDEDEDADEGGGLFDLKKLQTSLSENINRGYLESVKHLREMLMAYEWHLHGKELAERKGVAKFEQYCADHDIPVTFDAMTQLYSNPNDLSSLPDDKTKLLARSIIQQAVDERYCSIYYECTVTAKELAHTGLKDVIPDSAGKVGGVIKDLLPLPGFLKK